MRYRKFLLELHYLIQCEPLSGGYAKEEPAVGVVRLSSVAWACLGMDTKTMQFSVLPGLWNANLGSHLDFSL
jgi:hypothetical protein